MDSAVRKKRTLAERRESDKLRQRRFRAKKRVPEEARILQVVSGSVEKEKKERVYSLPKKTADEIRETNRIRQQRFRAKRRGDGSSEESGSLMEIEEQKPEILIVENPPAPILLPQIQETPMALVQRILMQAASEEKNRQTEIRREKDRIRKRRERQRKKENALEQAGFTTEQIMRHRLQNELDYLNNGTDQDQDDDHLEEMEHDEFEREEEEGYIEAHTKYIDPTNVEIKEEEVSEGVEQKDDIADSSEYFDASHVMATLEEMGLVLGVVTPSDGSEGSPTLELKQKTPEKSSEESTSSTPPTPSFEDMALFPEKKPWQRCNSSEERRERERMRKRMYRAKQKYFSTGKLEMKWDPSPIKRSPNDESEEGITPLPDWNSSFSSEQKLVAHRIYNKRYRERLKSSALKDEASRSQSRESSLGESSKNDDTLPPVTLTDLLSALSEQNSSSLICPRTE